MGTTEEEAVAWTQGFEQGFSQAEAQNAGMILQLKEDMKELLLTLQELLDSHAEDEGPDPDALYHLSARSGSIRRARAVLDAARRGGLM